MAVSSTTKCHSTVTFHDDLIHFTCEDGVFSNGDSYFLTSEQYADGLETAWTEEAADAHAAHPIQKRVAFTFRRCTFERTAVPFRSPIFDVRSQSLTFEDCTFDGCPIFAGDFEADEEFEEYAFGGCAFNNCGMVRLFEREGFQECGIRFKKCSHAGELPADVKEENTAKPVWERDAIMQVPALCH